MPWIFFFFFLLSDLLISEVTAQRPPVLSQVISISIIVLKIHSVKGFPCLNFQKPCFQEQIEGIVQDNWRTLCLLIAFLLNVFF